MIYDSTLSVFKASKCDSRIKTTLLFDASLQFMDLTEEINNKETLATPLLNFRRGSFDYEPFISMLIDQFKDKIDAETFKKHIITYDTVLRDSKKNQRNLFNYLSEYKSFIKLIGSSHISFNDYSILKVEKLESETKAHEVINDTTIKFLNEFLCGKKGEYSAYIKNDDYLTLIDEFGNEIM